MKNKILHFAYGSNMLSRRLCAADRTPSAVAFRTGFVKGRRLTFDKVSCDGSGKCDIEATDNLDNRVYGVLYKINKSEKPALDRIEGLGKGYKEEMVDVVTSSGAHQAVTYVATSKEPALRPYHWYKAIVIAGAIEHSLPESYIEWIRTVDSKPDPNVKRRFQNEKLLFDS
jgi:cation transport regulator ChaC